MADKFFQRRESKIRRNQKSSILEAIAQLGVGGDAAVDGGAPPPTRMKIVVRKEDLKQVLEAIRDKRGRAPPAAAAALEQRLNLMRRRQALKAALQEKGRSRAGPWRPVLQSIPEEPI